MTYVARSAVRGFLASFLGVAVVVVIAASSWALPAIQQVDTNPQQLELNHRTNIRITAVIAGAAEILGGGFVLERLNAQGTPRVIGLLNDLGLGGDAARGDGIQTVLQSFNEPQAGRVNLRIVGVVFLKSEPRKPVRLESPVFTLPVGGALPPGSGATIPGPGGTSVTVPPGTFDAAVVVGITPVPPSRVTAATGNFSVISAVEIIVQDTGYGDGPGPAAHPLEISVPLPAGVTDTEFIVGEQVLIDSITGTPGLKSQFIARALATAVGGNIVTQPSPLSGIRHTGVHVILGAIGSAVVTGTVLNPWGGPAAGAVVSSNTNTVVDVTDPAGHYSLFVSGGVGGVGPFTVTAFHPFQGSIGSTSGVIQTHGVSIPNVDINLVQLAAPALTTRDGVRNAGFELCVNPDVDGHGNLTGTWAFTGSARAVPATQFGTMLISPTEGHCMVDFNTGTGAVANVGSALKQRFIVPAGVTWLRVDFNFVSEEFPEFVGTEFNDTFRALITTPDGQSQFATVDVNNAGGFTLIGDCGFPGGDATCGTTGWRTGKVDLSAHAGTGTPIEVELLFTVDDYGDNIFDTHVLVDNIRFGTVWVDAKVLDGANANLAGIESDVRIASEVLSQAGLSVRLRNNNFQPLNSQTPGYNANLLDTNLDYVEGTVACVPPAADPAQRDGQRTQEEIDLLALLHSPIQTNVNVYYARSATRTDGYLISGYAIGPDEYCHQLNILTNSGLLLMDRRLIINSPAILAHELGHLLISPANATSTLEHNAGSTNFMNGSGTIATAVVTRGQSAIVNRVGSPLVVCDDEVGSNCQ